MNSLDLLYNATALQSKNKGILKFKGDKDQWKQRKRNMRRVDRMRLKDVSKSNLPYHSD